MLETTQPVYNAAQIRYIENYIIQEYNISAQELMHRAGQALFHTISRQWPMHKSLCVVTGAGNNAGDGFVVAGLALRYGWKVSVTSLSDPSKLPVAAQHAYQNYIDLGGLVEPFGTKLPNMELYLDALFGIGLNRPVEGDYKRVIKALNQQTRPVIAVDIPSGLNANTGQVMGSVVKAYMTLTFIALKVGLITGQAAEYVGQLSCDALDLKPNQLAKLPMTGALIGSGWIKSVLPKRCRTAHKGDFGHALIVGGGQGLMGAIRLAGEAALRTGSGLVSVATHPEHAANVNSTRPELMVQGINTLEALEPLLSRCSVLAIGPGLGVSDWAQALFQHILGCKHPKVIDADALNLLAQNPQRRLDWILTPHPGEAARLLNCTVIQIEQDRVLAAQQLQQRYGGVVVLKGAGSIIADSAGLSFCKEGNPGMASGGMGDVLTGIIVGLLAQGLALDVAAKTGVCIHALAGDIAAEQGERGLLAGDLIQHLRLVVNP